MNTNARDDNDKRSCGPSRSVPQTGCPLLLRSKISICYKCTDYFLECYISCVHQLYILTFRLCCYMKHKFQNPSMGKLIAVRLFPLCVLGIPAVFVGLSRVPEIPAFAPHSLGRWPRARIIMGLPRALDCLCRKRNGHHYYRALVFIYHKNLTYFIFQIIFRTSAINMRCLLKKRWTCLHNTIGDFPVPTNACAIQGTPIIIFRVCNSLLKYKFDSFILAIYSLIYVSVVFITNEHTGAR